MQPDVQIPSIHPGDLGHLKNQLYHRHDTVAVAPQIRCCLGLVVSKMIKTLVLTLVPQAEGCGKIWSSGDLGSFTAERKVVAFSRRHCI